MCRPITPPRRPTSRARRSSTRSSRSSRTAARSMCSARRSRRDRQLGVGARRARNVRDASRGRASGDRGLRRVGSKRWKRSSRAAPSRRARSGSGASCTTRSSPSTTNRAIRPKLCTPARSPRRRLLLDAHGGTRRLAMAEVLSERCAPRTPLEKIGRVIGRLADDHVPPASSLPEIERQMPELERWVREHDLIELDPDETLDRARDAAAQARHRGCEHRLAGALRRQCADLLQRHTARRLACRARRELAARIQPLDAARAQHPRGDSRALRAARLCEPLAEPDQVDLRQRRDDRRAGPSTQSA